MYICDMKRNDKGMFVKGHGMCFSSEYISWASMKSRCLNPDAKHEKYRGLLTHEKWIESFDEFLKDMGMKPTCKHTIERIDNSKGYFPENCRWATRSEQNRNYSLNRIIEFNGEKMCVTEWAEKLNIPRHRIFNRLQKGWDVEKALYYGLEHRKSLLLKYKKMFNA